jgi:hypothetical protein
LLDIHQNIGLLKIVGILIGEKMDMFELNVE